MRPLRVPFLIAAAAAALYLFAAESRDFWAPDEPDFAEHVREMIERHDLLVPYQNGVPYSEKPIFFYWAVTATTRSTYSSPRGAFPARWSRETGRSPTCLSF